MRAFKIKLHIPTLNGWRCAKRNFGWLLIACVFFSCGFFKAYAQQPLLDYQIKAAMVYKFLGYGTWPANHFSTAHSPYRIWVLGSDEIKNELQQIVAQRLIDGRPIEIYSANTVNQIGDAHLVFLARNMEQVLPALSSVAQKKSFLIVTENDQGLIDGSAINLRLVNQRIGFEISLIAARKYGVSLSSRLLAIAISVEEARD